MSTWSAIVLDSERSPEGISYDATAAQLISAAAETVRTAHVHSAKEINGSGK